MHAKSFIIHGKPPTRSKKSIYTFTPFQLFFRCKSPTRSIRTISTCMQIHLIVYCNPETRWITTFNLYTSASFFLLLVSNSIKNNYRHMHVESCFRKLPTRSVITIYTCTTMRLPFYSKRPTRSVRSIYTSTPVHCSLTPGHLPVYSKPQSTHTRHSIYSCSLVHLLVSAKHTFIHCKLCWNLL